MTLTEKIDDFNNLLNIYITDIPTLHIKKANYFISITKVMTK